MFGLALLQGSGVRLEGERVILRAPRFSDHREWVELRRSSRRFLEPWEPSWRSDEFSRRAWRDRLRHCHAEHRRGTGLYFFLIERQTSRLVGGLSVMNIRRGIFESAQIGYWMGESHAGRGLMGEALQLVLAHCFDTIGLQRIEAACIPDNARSIRVLEKAGFLREGLMRSYLRINGVRRDHLLYAVIADQYRNSTKSGHRV